MCGIMYKLPEAEQTIQTDYAARHDVQEKVLLYVGYLETYGISINKLEVQNQPVVQ
jgi:hypothetical protein